jgi:hypothetical protein
LLWGATSTRKTEGVLRNFPHVLIIDTEGNTDQCVDVPEISEFMRVVTKDSRDVMAIMDQVAAGQITFPDGSPVETLCIATPLTFQPRAEAAGKGASRGAPPSIALAMNSGRDDKGGDIAASPQDIGDAAHQVMS